jgi:hypothetical protein
MEQLRPPASTQTGNTPCTATLRYLQDLPLYQSAKPYVLKRAPPPGVPRSNVRGIDCNNIIIKDVRGHEGDFCLERQGFAFGKFETKQRMDTSESIERYMAEVREYLAATLGCDDVRIFEFKVGHMIGKWHGSYTNNTMVDKLRSSGNESRPAEPSDLPSMFQYRAPSKMVHIGKFGGNG